MGRKARAKRERRVATPERPRWAGAPGFDRTYRIAEQYIDVHQQLTEALAIPYEDSPAYMGKLADATREELLEARERANAQIRRASAVIHGLNFRSDLIRRQYATLRAAAGKPVELENDEPTEVLPADRPRSDLVELHGYGESLAALAQPHLRVLREAVPIVFDPLAVPNPSTEALHGFALPFPAVVTDFLAPSGLSLPVQGISKNNDWWVGLVAATITQTDENGPVDVWPTVTTLRADRDNTEQVPRELMFGTVRFGAPLPPPPVGLRHVKLDDCEAWVVDIDKPEPWAMLWLRAPALAAISALRLLDAVNVDLVDVPLARAAQRRAEREGARPALMVDVRTTHHSSAPDPTGNTGVVEWSQRWTVRGHWKHFSEHTSVARRHPSRVIDVPGHGRCVRVWCPPHVKGPANKPLVLKTRVVSVG